MSATVNAPAKLTISLQVTGVRPDGFHLIDAEMVTLDLCDTLTITEAQLLAGADDVDDAAQLSVENLSSDSGTITDNGNGTYTFTPNADFNGQVNLSYDVSDGTASHHLAFDFLIFGQGQVRRVS